MNIDRINIGLFLLATFFWDSLMLGTKRRERINPMPVMATWSQKMIRQLANVTMIPPKQGPNMVSHFAF